MASAQANGQYKLKPGMVIAKETTVTDFVGEEQSILVALQKFFPEVFTSQTGTILISERRQPMINYGLDITP